MFDYPTSTTCTCNDSSTIWTPWCETANTTATTNTTTIWYHWASDNCTGSDVCVKATWKPPQETPEEIARREAERRKAEEIRVKAEERANELLRELLAPDQRVQYDEKRRFYLVAQSGKRYEVDCTRRQHNVYEVDAVGKRLEEHCIYARADNQLPLGDNAAAQLLLLQHDEQEFRRIANQRRLTG
jgi:hypothetical protein